MSKGSERRKEKLEEATEIVIAATSKKNYISCFMGKIDLSGYFTVEELEAIVYLAKANKLFKL